MNIVIDTHVIVSGLLSPFGHVAHILALLANGKLIPYFDTRMLAEYHDVLYRPKFAFDKNKLATFLKELELVGELVIGVPLQNSLPDPADNMFLEVALACNAECIVTGNLNHFPEHDRCGVTVLSPLEFMTYYRDK